MTIKPFGSFLVWSKILTLIFCHISNLNYLSSGKCCFVYFKVPNVFYLISQTISFLSVFPNFRTSQHPTFHLFHPFPSILNFLSSQCLTFHFSTLLTFHPLHTFPSSQLPIFTTSHLPSFHLPSFTHLRHGWSREWYELIYWNFDNLLESRCFLRTLFWKAAWNDGILGEKRKTQGTSLRSRDAGKLGGLEAWRHINTPGSLKA